MKAHLENPKKKFVQACVKGFNKITAQNFEIVTFEKYGDLMKRNPDYCCSKCKTIYLKLKAEADKDGNK